MCALSAIRQEPPSVLSLTSRANGRIGPNRPCRPGPLRASPDRLSGRFCLVSLSPSQYRAALLIAGGRWQRSYRGWLAAWSERGADVEFAVWCRLVGQERPYCERLSGKWRCSRWLSDCISRHHIDAPETAQSGNAGGLVRYRTGLFDDCSNTPKAKNWGSHAFICPGVISRKDCNSDREHS